MTALKAFSQATKRPASSVTSQHFSVSALRKISCDHLLPNTCNVDRNGERQHFENRRHLPASLTREEV